MDEASDRTDIRLQDIMNPAVTVGPDTTAREALGIMLEHWFHSLPVVDSEGNLEGIITDALLLESAVPPYLRHMNSLPLISEEADSWVDYLTEASEETVREVMSREVSHVELGKSEAVAAHKMVHDGVPSVVVTDGGKVAGVVDRLDLYKAIVGLS